MNATHPMTGYVHTMYGLHALAGLMGVTSGATVIGAFVFGLTVLCSACRHDRAALTRR